MRTFGGIDPAFAGKNSQIWLQSIPYDGTSTWGKGADKGLDALMGAAENMELYDIETDSEVYRRGIHVLPEIAVEGSPEAVYKAAYALSLRLLESKKFLTFLGGEHSISIGIIKAFYETINDLTVVQLDAHADLRPTYNGSPYNHACALHDASQNANLIQVGIRSMDVSEKQYMDMGKVYFAHQLLSDEWMTHSINQMTENVYITLDLDVFDPGIMPATGTPEPGGMTWNQMMRYLKKLFSEKNVVGFDIVELAPIDGLRSPEFLAAKLYYKMLSYKFYQNG